MSRALFVTLPALAALTVGALLASACGPGPDPDVMVDYWMVTEVTDDVAGAETAASLLGAVGPELSVGGALVVLDHVTLSSAPMQNSQVTGSRFSVEQMVWDDDGTTALTAQIRRTRGPEQLKVERHLSSEHPLLLARTRIELGREDQRRHFGAAQPGSQEIEVLLIARVRRVP